jgi:hypothetical protein
MTVAGQGRGADQAAEAIARVFGADNRARLLARYFAANASVTPASAWQHVYPTSSVGLRGLSMRI